MDLLERVDYQHAFSLQFLVPVPVPVIRLGGCYGKFDVASVVESTSEDMGRQLVEVLFL